MGSTFFAGSVLLLGAFLLLAFRYEFNMPVVLSLLLSVPALALGIILAYLGSVLSGLPMWQLIVGMNVACFLLALWSESRSSSTSV